MSRLLVCSILMLQWLCAQAQGQSIAEEDREPAAKKKSKVESAQATAKGRSVERIVVKGNKKIEEEAIRAKLITKAGEPYEPKKLRQDLSELFSTGFFFDVEVDESESGRNVILVYTVTERPSISEVEYMGNDEVSDDDLRETSGLKPFEILDHAKIREALVKLEKMYEDKGFFLARLSYKLDPPDENGNVKLIVSVVENDKVVVKKVSFLGNKHMDSGRLKSGMITKEGGFFSFISGSGAYKQDAFDRDVQLLSYLYFNEGFVQVKVDRPQVYVTPDKKGIFITIRIEEGEQFNVGTVDFNGDLLFSKDELFEASKIDDSGLFVYETLQEDLRTIQAKYGDLGYAFANIIPRTRTREQDKQVDITFEIDKGNKVYIGKINVVGNTKTRDKVLRREMRIREGELYHETRKRESLANIKRLGFFEEVNFNTKTPKGANDVMDIEIVVKERNTGTIQVGAGYSSFYGAVFNGQVNQINFLGKGQKLGASMDLSKKQSLFRFSFTEPYFMDTEWSAGVDLYQSRRTLLEYAETKKGGALRVGHPLAPYLEGYIRYKIDDTELDLVDNGDPDLFPVDTANGITSSVTLTLEYDKRNDRFTPSKGVFASGSIEYAGLGGDKDYTKGYTSFRYYKEVFWNLVWRNNLSYGFISSNDPSKDPPFNELFLLGGANSLRGYDWFSIGKRKFSEKAFNIAKNQGLSDQEAMILAMRPFGGTQQLFYNLEMEFPLIREAGIKGVVFYDIGDADDTLDFSDFRSDMGFGIRWFSPIGPLRFEWGFPFNPKDEFNEGPYNFEFAIGSPF